MFESIKINCLHYTLSSLCVLILFFILFFRVQRKVFSLCVYKLEEAGERYDSINTLVIHSDTRSLLIPIIGDHDVLVHFDIVRNIS